MLNTITTCLCPWWRREVRVYGLPSTSTRCRWKGAVWEMDIFVSRNIVCQAVAAMLCATYRADLGIVLQKLSVCRYFQQAYLLYTYLGMYLRWSLVTSSTVSEQPVVHTWASLVRLEQSSQTGQTGYDNRMSRVPHCQTVELQTDRQTPAFLGKLFWAPCLALMAVGFLGGGFCGVVATSSCLQ